MRQAGGVGERDTTVFGGGEVKGRLNSLCLLIIIFLCDRLKLGEGCLAHDAGPWLAGLILISAWEA